MVDGLLKDVLRLVEDIAFSREELNKENEVLLEVANLENDEAKAIVKQGYEAANIIVDEVVNLSCRWIWNKEEEVDVSTNAEVEIEKEEVVEIVIKESPRKMKQWPKLDGIQTRSNCNS